MRDEQKTAVDFENISTLDLLAVKTKIFLLKNSINLLECGNRVGEAIRKIERIQA